MTKIELIKKLQELECNSNTKVYIHAEEIDDFVLGWYLDDNFDKPEIILEDPENYDINPNQKKVIDIF